jgi:hypothetical protein
MWKPGPPLANVQACFLEATLHGMGVLPAVRAGAFLVDEHADPRRLAVATQDELRSNGPRSAPVEDLCDAIGVVPWPVAEERDREMEVFGSDPSRFGRVEAGRPGCELPRGSLRDRQTDEEA